MDRMELGELLREVIECKQQLDQQWERLEGILGTVIDSPFGVACWKPMDLLIEYVDASLCCGHSTLEWFIWDNDCGAKGLRHSLPDGEMRLVESVDDLLDVLGQ